MAHTTCCHCVPPGNLRTTEGTRRAGLCEDIFSVTASREVGEDEPWVGGRCVGGETQSEVRVRCAAIFALHRVDTVGHPCLGQARAGARDERVEWGLMGWGLDHR